MPSHKLTRMFGLSEDRVATRALTDIIGKAIESGALSDIERRWAQKLSRAIEKSGPDQLVYPKLSFEPEVGDETSKAAKPKASKAPSPKRSIDDVEPAPDVGLARSGGKSVQDPEMAKQQSVWDTFGSYPTKPQGDVELGAAGASLKQVEPVVQKKPGMLSRIFGTRDKKGPDVRSVPEFDPTASDPSYAADFPRLKRPKSAATKVKARPERRPGKAVSQSTWDDLTHGKGREPEERK